MVIYYDYKNAITSTSIIIVCNHHFYPRHFFRETSKQTIESKWAFIKIMNDQYNVCSMAS